MDNHLLEDFEPTEYRMHKRHRDSEDAPKNEYKGKAFIAMKQSISNMNGNTILTVCAAVGLYVANEKYDKSDRTTIETLCKKRLEDFK